MDNLVTSFNNQLFGLMGNFNGDKTDDLVSRNGDKPTNMTLERSIYPIASSCNHKINYKEHHHSV